MEALCQTAFPISLALYLIYDAAVRRTGRLDNV